MKMYSNLYASLVALGALTISPAPVIAVTTQTAQIFISGGGTYYGTTDDRFGPISREISLSHTGVSESALSSIGIFGNLGVSGHLATTGQLSTEVRIRNSQMINNSLSPQSATANFIIDGGTFHLNAGDGWELFYSADLGLFVAGEVFSLTYTLRTAANIVGFSEAAFYEFSNPLSVGGMGEFPSVRFNEVAPVPLPAALPLFSGGPGLFA